MTPMRGATIGTALYGGVLIASLAFMVFSPGAFAALLPMVVAYPVSGVLVPVLKPTVGMEAAVTVSGALSTGCWFLLLFVAGTLIDSLRAPPTPPR